MILPKRNLKKIQFLKNFSKITLTEDKIAFIHSPKEYKLTLLQQIAEAKKHIYIVALYLERDEAGQEILQALYNAKKHSPNLAIKIIVDFHRAQRGLIGEQNPQTNAQFYYEFAKKNPNINIEIVGVPINKREIFGILHLKGIIIDDKVLYSGASINNVYLHQFSHYRYDRYHLIHNQSLANSFINYIESQFFAKKLTKSFLQSNEKIHIHSLSRLIKKFRKKINKSTYIINDNDEKGDIFLSPLVGLGKKSLLNLSIQSLLLNAKEKVIISTPYFNFPPQITNILIKLLKQGKSVEIIVSDKTANDFYIPENEPFKIIGGIVYFYEINLRRFLKRFQYFIYHKKLIVRLWKNEKNSFHVKGIWIDDSKILITGNNLNPRAFRFDLENGILIDDPSKKLQEKVQKELDCIREFTNKISHFEQIESLKNYPPKVKKLLRRLQQTRLDRLIKLLL